MDESEEGGPVSSFQSLAAEGDILYKQGDLKKAIEAYSKVPLTPHSSPNKQHD